MGFRRKKKGKERGDDTNFNLKTKREKASTSAVCNLVNIKLHKC